MKKITLYKVFNLYGRSYRWSIDEDGDCEPFEVEIPDDFRVGESVSYEKMFFRDGDPQGYELVSEGKNASCMPKLIGGTNVNVVKLKVIKPVK